MGPSRLPGKLEGPKVAFVLQKAGSLASPRGWHVQVARAAGKYQGILAYKRFVPRLRGRISTLA